MDGVAVIDRFTEVFTAYIDSGFGLLGSEVAFLTATLVVIDMTVAGLFWAMGGEDILARLVRKTLYVGFFALLLGNWTQLTKIVFDSFAGLGLAATGGTLTPAELLQPGRIAQVGIDAGRPVLAAVAELMGFMSFFDNFLQIFVLLLAWLVVILAFFVLAVQLFVTLVEFKLTTLVGFVLVPFGLWGKSAFLAERVLGNVVASGVKVLVLAIIVGIGTTLFAEFTDSIPPGTQPSLDDALAIVLAALAMLGLGIFGPGIASGLAAGAPQLGAGAAIGTALTAAGAGVAAGAGALAVGGAGLTGVRAAATAVSTGRAGFEVGRAASGASGLAGTAAGVAGAVRAGAGALGVGPSVAGPSAAASGSAPAWAIRLRATAKRGAELALRTVRHADGPGQGALPSLDPEGR